MDTKGDSIAPKRISKRRLPPRADEDTDSDSVHNDKASDESDSYNNHDLDIEMLESKLTSSQTTSPAPVRPKRNFKKPKNYKIPESLFQEEPLTNLCPLGFKLKVMKAFQQSKVSTTTYVKYNIRVIMAKRRKLTPIEKEFILIKTFGYTKAQIKTAGDAKASDPKASSKVEVIIIKAFKNASHTSYISKLLRMQFEGLVRQFWELQTPVIKEFATNWATQAKLRAPEPVLTGNQLVATPNQIKCMFLKDNTKLISDIWAPILNVYTEHILLNDPEWAQYFTECTAIILCHLLTAWFKLPNPLDEIQKLLTYVGQRSMSGFPLTSPQIGDHIAQADFIPTPVTWPKFNRPEKWNTARGKCPIYGQLTYSVISGEISIEEIDQSITEEGLNPYSENPYPPPPAYTKIPPDLVQQTNTNIAQWVIVRINQDIDTLIKQELKAKHSNTTIDAAAFVEAVKDEYTQAAKRETDPTNRRSAPSINMEMIMTKDVIGAFHLIVGEIKRQMTTPLCPSSPSPIATPTDNPTSPSNHNHSESPGSSTASPKPVVDGNAPLMPPPPLPLHVRAQTQAAASCLDLSTQA
ncbi:hypothetical protein BGX38DRAFT_1277442 [Terfezia claveryi]|nr:hypothetical protein BGX38DRAFT_1277442 [Terfezia claveryi]